MSLVKIKCHSTTSVTLSFKNFLGIAPSVIIDLNRARSVQLAIIDGIWTAEGGAGPWNAPYRRENHACF
jgi:uncharacterized protein (DUF362 family)